MIRPTKALMFALIVSASAGFGNNTIAGEQDWHTSRSLIGTPKYATDFKHYDHANPNAPKGGTLNEATVGSFDSFNPFVVRGRPAAGLTYHGGILYDKLFSQSADQSSTSYGLVAEAFRQADDYSWAVYRLNPKAKWHDGKPITPEDVVWTVKMLRETHPLWTQYYKNVERVEITGEREISFFFDIKNNRELPSIIGDLPVLPKHWWTGKDAEGNQRDITKPTTEPPLGSGPYRIGKFNMGKNITWERVEDYWGLEQPQQVGRYNFGEIKYTYFLEPTAQWEAFKKGGIVDYREENRSQRWVRGYNFPAFKKKEVLKKEFPESGPQVFQGYFINTRKEKFKDRNVRRALNLLFNFESMNRTLFYDAYTRTDGFFVGGELSSSGLPQGRELEILEPYRGKIPDEVFSQEFKIPNYSVDGSFRKGQREALKLFKAAGYTFNKGKMLDANGNQFTIEVISNSPTSERIANPFFENLRVLGIAPNLRILDTAQYKNRIDKFDFEIAGLASIQSLSPGNEQREYWGSHAAKTNGSSNYAGISDPAIDELIEKIISAADRKELVHYTHALDRVLKWNYYTIPQWYHGKTRLAWWNKLKFEENQPTYTGVDVFSFWIDPEFVKKSGDSN